MTCSFCNKSASKQYYLCDCCMVTLERCNSTAKNTFNTQEQSVPVIPLKEEQDASVRTIECISCLGRFQEDELLQHRESCTATSVFRCAVCLQDYMSKEGLWNHLDLHEVADENKPMEYHEMKVAHNLLKCVLCNDQRGYGERLYWQHVHEDHDGFFLQCSECEECFRSQKLLTEHALNHCNAREQATSSISNGPITKQKHVDSQFSESSHDDSQIDHMEDNKSEQDLNKVFSSATEEISQPLVGKLPSASNATKCPHCGKDCFDKTLLAHHIKFRHPSTKCDICGIAFTSINQARYHKMKHHTEQKHKCPHCSMKFRQRTEFQRHLSKHLEDRKYPSEIGQTLRTATILPDLKDSSELDKHQEQGSDEDLLEGHYEFVAIKEEISVEEATIREDNVDMDASSSTIIHCPICGGQYGNKDENQLAVHVEMIHQLYICTICGMMFPKADQLKDHEDQQHSAHCFNGSYNHQGISNTGPIETVKPRSSHYASSFFENPTPATATVQELNPSYADEDVSNCNSSVGWEVYTTVPADEIESRVLAIEFGFRFKTQNVPSKGKMRYYQCRRIKVRVVPQCERKLLVFIPHTPNNDADATISLKGKHTCANALPELMTRPNFNEIDCELITDSVKPEIPFFETSTPTEAAGQELNPSYLAEEDVLNCSSFDGWEIFGTVPLNEIESRVLSIEFGFRFKTQNIPFKGKMRYYNCRRIKVRVIPQCERKLLVFIPNTDSDATISLKGKHTCVNAPPALLARAKLNEMDCELVTNLVKSGVPTRDVKKHFRVMNSEVSDNQLRYAVQSALKIVRK